MAFADWIKSVEGKYIDVDKWYGSQCVDVVMNYVEYLFPGKRWYDTIGRGNAKDLWDTASTEHFEKIPNSPDPNHIPRPGDIVVWNAAGSNPYGHIAVVLAASPQNITLMEQDGFIDKDSNGNADGVAYRKTRNWTNNIIGWLRPKAQPTTTPSGGGSNMFNTDQEVIEAYLMLRGVRPSSAEVKSWLGQPKQRFFQVGKAEADSVRKQLADVKVALVNAQNKPPTTVIKEVVKIVDRPVEVIKTVEVIKEVPADEKAVVEGFFRRIWNSLFNKK